MSYHPIYGIVFFFICLLIAFLFGRKSNFTKDCSKNYKSLSSSSTHEFIAPDASWLDKKDE